YYHTVSWNAVSDADGYKIILWVDGEDVDEAYDISSNSFIYGAGDFEDFYADDTAVIPTSLEAPSGKSLVYDENSNLLLLGGSKLGIGTTSSSSMFMLQASAGVNPFSIASSSGESIFSILSNGNVGIGTSSPISKFAVSGNSFFGGDLTTT